MAPPLEPDRCADCQTAYIAQDGPIPLETRLRASYLEGAEEQSTRTLGRGLTAEELARVVGRYPTGER